MTPNLDFMAAEAHSLALSPRLPSPEVADLARLVAGILDYLAGGPDQETADLAAATAEEVERLTRAWNRFARGFGSLADVVEGVEH